MTLGSIIRSKRTELKLSLRALGAKVLKDGGTPVSPQFIMDIEHDKRTPSPFVLAGISVALDIDVHYLTALAGHYPPAVVAYLGAHPEAAKEMTAFFNLVCSAGFTDWDALAVWLRAYVFASEMCNK